MFRSLIDGSRLLVSYVFVLIKILFTMCEIADGWMDTMINCVKRDVINFIVCLSLCNVRVE